MDPSFRSAAALAFTALSGPLLAGPSAAADGSPTAYAATPGSQPDEGEIHGGIDDVAVGSRVLTDTEIASLWHDGQGNAVPQQ